MIDENMTLDGKFSILRDYDTGCLGLECHIEGSEFSIPIDEENIKELKNVLRFTLE